VFVFDSATQRYRRSVDSSGPADGVRFLLYQADSVRPLFPLTALGWMDLVDLSPGAAPGAPDSLHGLVSGSGLTPADYVTAPKGTQLSYSQILSGTITDGTRALAFRDSTYRLGGQLTVTATIDDSAAGVHLSLAGDRTVLDQFDNFYGVDFSFTHGTETVRLTGRNDTYCLLTTIAITVTVNGGSFARVTNGMSASMPTITRADSQPLSGAQRTAVLDLLRGQHELYAWLAALSSPGALTLAP
jgi:hypothetical protein